MCEEDRYKDYEEPEEHAQKGFFRDLIYGADTGNMKGSGTRNLRIDENTTLWCRSGTVASIAILIAAIVSTLLLFPIGTIASLYITSLALFIGFDGLNIFGRVLAPQSRYMIAGLFQLYAIGFYTKVKQYYLVLVIASLAIYVIVKLLNRRLLDNHNYLMTPAIQQALNNNDGTVVFEAWQVGGGKRDTITYARYSDIDASESTVDGVYRGIWSLGYLYAYKNMKKAKNDAEEAVEECKMLLSELKSKKEENIEFKKIIKSLSAELNEKNERVENLEAELSAKKTTIGFLSAEKREIQRDNETMAELLVAEKPEEKPLEMVKQSEKDRAVMLLKNGLKPMQVAEQMNIPKTRVYDEYCPLAFPDQYELVGNINGKNKYRKKKAA